MEVKRKGNWKAAFHDKVKYFTDGPTFSTCALVHVAPARSFTNNTWHAIRTKLRTKLSPGCRWEEGRRQSRDDVGEIW